MNFVFRACATGVAACIVSISDVFGVIIVDVFVFSCLSYGVEERRQTCTVEDLLQKS